MAQMMNEEKESLSSFAAQQQQPTTIVNNPISFQNSRAPNSDNNAIPIINLNPDQSTTTTTPNA